jgi:hypothetical protein
MREELRELARALPRDAGPGVEAVVLKAFRARRRRDRRPWFYAAAAALLACGLYAAGWASGHRQGIVSAERGYEAMPVGFVALPYSQSGVPLENPVIVRMDIKVSELGAFGVQANATGGVERVRADLLVGQDGVARAVRFVP